MRCDTLMRLESLKAEDCICVTEKYKTIYSKHRSEYKTSHMNERTREIECIQGIGKRNKYETETYDKAKDCKKRKPDDESV
ncbi:hypothetical protein RCL_jg15676.t1 [Rhizophagus clarus]|uniref:Uncharacterized protein n=1 Tax=Rhizophagus clarus TaxID=94130 RepID=A0A8H3R2Y6_9GLOM|nr:hypothetical protein RCL_jg15676.t1 [Rhizophagus clarus]